jgi:hypothetical protein
MNTVDIKNEAPPPGWGVRVDARAIERLASSWKSEAFVVPQWDYPGLPAGLPPAAWFDFCGLAVSVLACLWPPEGEAMWSTEHHGHKLTDAPALFSCFVRGVPISPSGLETSIFAGWTEDGAESFFAGSGVLQLIPARRRVLKEVSVGLGEMWEGHFMNLVEDAGFSAPGVAKRLVNSFPSYRDERKSDQGLLAFNKLAHLSAAMMASGSGVPFTGLETFPVYPDYMLPMVLRHFGVLSYEQELADAVDGRHLIPAGSNWELGIRWATVYAGHQLADELHRLGNPVVTPALDYFLWHQAVLGPHAGTMGEHHRTVTMAY